MDINTFESRSEEDTRKWGMSFARTLSPGNVIGIAGEFGAGKTRLVKAICEYFGISSDKVTSPSFTLIHEYHGREKIVHMDTYRLKSSDEFELLDIDYYLDKNAIILVEWANRVMRLLPRQSKIINIEIKGKNRRRISLLKDNI